MPNRCLGALLYAHLYVFNALALFMGSLSLSLCASKTCFNMFGTHLVNRVFDSPHFVGVVNVYISSKFRQSAAHFMCLKSTKITSYSSNYKEKSQGNFTDCQRVNHFLERNNFLFFMWLPYHTYSVAHFKWMYRTMAFDGSTKFYPRNDIHLAMPEKTSKKQSRARNESKAQ